MEQKTGIRKEFCRRLCIYSLHVYTQEDCCSEIVILLRHAPPAYVGDEALPADRVQLE